jgi:hypothetical protein
MVPVNTPMRLGACHAVSIFFYYLPNLAGFSYTHSYQIAIWLLSDRWPLDGHQIGMLSDSYPGAR